MTRIHHGPYLHGPCDTTIEKRTFQFHVTVSNTASSWPFCVHNVWDLRRTYYSGWQCWFIKDRIYSCRQRKLVRTLPPKLTFDFQQFVEGPHNINTKWSIYQGTALPQHNNYLCNSEFFWNFIRSPTIQWTLSSSKTSPTHI